MTELNGSTSSAASPPPRALDVFGPGLEGAIAYAEMLATHGAERGLIGPREASRLWDRHLLNSAVLAELIPPGARVIDVGSGAGLPGIPLALARPDLTMYLVEPMARRVRWLDEVVAELKLSVEVVRGRAEDRDLRRRLGEADVVTARAVAPLARLAGWCLPLVRIDGRLLAIKGASASEEVERDRDELATAGWSAPEIVQCGREVLDEPTIVVSLRRNRPASTTRPFHPRARSVGTRDYARRTRKDR
jgi:16S rRNA (guanine527-N7)-methyltransferase